MDLGAFSVSMAVSDMAASVAFYSKLGFTQIGGDGESWTIVENGGTVIGLFQGMFEGTMLTFNPGWEGAGQETEHFTDVRELRAQLVAAGIEPTQDTTGDTAEGPASLAITDPDGTVILFDQHR